MIRNKKMKNPVYEMNAAEYNEKLAEALKKVPEFKEPEWSKFVKSGPHKERPVDEEDFWYKRAASILRQIYKKEVVGVNRLRTKYGGRKNRGMRPEEFRRASGKIIRVILQQADSAGFTEKIQREKRFKGRRLGRKLTDNGKNFLESIKPDETKEKKSSEESVQKTETKEKTPEKTESKKESVEKNNEKEIKEINEKESEE